eukprot:scaffold7033_cov257-Pinguiococcus_pyrenoidosus.AAC.25
MNLHEIRRHHAHLVLRQPLELFESLLHHEELLGSRRWGALSRLGPRLDSGQPIRIPHFGKEGALLRLIRLQLRTLSPQRRLDLSDSSPQLAAGCQAAQALVGLSQTTREGDDLSAPAAPAAHPYPSDPSLLLQRDDLRLGRHGQSARNRPRRKAALADHQGLCSLDIFGPALPSCGPMATRCVLLVTNQRRLKMEYPFGLRPNHLYRK